MPIYFGRTAITAYENSMKLHYNTISVYISYNWNTKKLKTSQIQNVMGFHGMLQRQIYPIYKYEVHITKCAHFL